MEEAFPRAYGRYTLLEHLAQGGMGSLYLACQGEAGMEKLCVVKTVLRELADKEYVARFRDEAKVVVRLSHGNLVPVFDAGSVEGELYIAMEHVDGRDLRAVWNRCAAKGIAFPVDVAVYLVKELARGLHHAHGAGDLKLVHRDVSPPNVLLAYSGEVKLTDFGLASSTLKMERTAPGVIYGKVSYMAPEQARGEPLDGRTDLYAAAIILWELLTGRQLFPTGDGDALAKVRAPQVQKPSSRASRVPAELDAITMKALSPSAEARYPDGEALRAALAAWLAREAPTTDAARVAAFLEELFGDEIEGDRQRRESLVADSRGQRPRASPPRAAGGPRLALEILEPSDERSLEEVSGGELPSPAALDDEDRSAGLVGTLVDGRYQVRGLIGEGGMGRVYEAEHVEIGKRVAMKVLHPLYSRSKELVARFRREARAASRIGHPNIIDVTDSGTTDGGAVYFVMEHLEGADLADVIDREKRLGVFRAVNIAIQTARALEAAHAAHVIHRDLKPENLFILARPGQPDFVKVLDFGIARHLGPDGPEASGGGPGAKDGKAGQAGPGPGGRKRLTRPDMAMGTPEYMAPEQAAGRAADERSDVYAAGAILYEMLVGKSPHTGENAMEILNRKATEVPALVSALRPDVPQELAQVIARALSRDPAARQQSMGRLAEELERCRPDRRAGGKGAAPAQPSRKLARGLVAASIVSVAAAALATALFSRSQAAAPAGGARTPLSSRAIGAPPSSFAGAPNARPVGDRKPVAPVAASPTATASAQAAEPDPDARASTHAASRAAPAASGRRPPATQSPPERRELDEANRLLQGHQLADAERAFDHLLDVGAPVERAAAAIGLSRVAYESGRFADAVRSGERAVRLGGGATAEMVLGDAYAKVGRYADAVRSFRAVLKLQPNHPDARHHLDAALQRAAGG